MLICSILIGTLLVTPARKDEVTLVAVGDCMLARGVGRKIEKFGLKYPFLKVADILQIGELGFCNLECALSGKVQPVSNNFVFQADPALSNTLSRAGFNLVSIANNHSLDCGVDGLKETIQVLTHMGITPILGEPCIRDVKGLKIGALAFNLVDGHPSSMSLVEAVRELKEVSDILIVSLHWGREYKLSPSKKQLKLAQELVDAGADLILGHHPHRVQGIDSYRKGIIAYSLGNFVFDQRDELGKQSIILLIRLNRNLVKRITIIPVVIIEFRPERASKGVGESIINRLIKQSAQLNTHILKVRWNGMIAGTIYPFQDEIDLK